MPLLPTRHHRRRLVLASSASALALVAIAATSTGDPVEAAGTVDLTASDLDITAIRVTPADRVPLDAGDAPVVAELTDAVLARAELEAVEPPPPPPPPPAPQPSGAVSLDVWDRLAQCEAGGNWSINTGNGYYGGLQFALSSWQWVGGTGYPHEASKATQIAMAERLLARQGWSAWPACSRALGLR